MDNPFVTGSIGASITIGLAIGYKIFQIINHKRVRSNCCGKKIEMSVDIESTSPQTIPSNTLTTREIRVDTKQSELPPIKIISG